MSAGPGPGGALDLTSPLTALFGVGKVRARALAAAGLVSLRDLLTYLPDRYEDRSAVRAIADPGAPGETVTVHGTLTAIRERVIWARRMRIVTATVNDGSGTLAVVWFNQPYLARSLEPGARVWLHGVLRAARARGAVELVSPEWEEEDDEDDLPLHLGRIVPIHRRLKGLNGRRLRALAAAALDAVGEAADPVGPWLPAELRGISLAAALRAVHFPATPGSESELAALLAELGARRSPAQRRLACEELLALAVAIERERQRRRGQKAVAARVDGRVRDRARTILPFRLTAAQRRALAEIVADLQRSYPMARLLQGDVGSGKTIVATLAALVMLESGAQVALLAPTELLARQHGATLAGWLGPIGHAPELLLGSLRPPEKRRVRALLGGGGPLLVVGTHALLEDDVVFGRLGLVIVDEQHRFGATQRQTLLEKGTAPHLLVMTATPIPRSLALSLYGDLDVSVLDELPAGRQPVRTVVREDGARAKLLQFVKGEIANGGQVYWVFSVIEESEKGDLRAVELHAGAVAAALPGVRTAVVHGRLPAAERDAVMRSFGAGEVKLLCSTTVIEVGVDVPNACVMVIENAERFGLAQLHQLRGRVGRGARRSTCVLLAGAGCSEEARHRLELVAATADGFRIAEEDFALRGPGELTGARQWGRPELRVASLTVHRRELEAARATAARAAAEGRLCALSRALGIAEADAPAIPSA
jgi:ATP-dependent DNA helicase RecG